MRKVEKVYRKVRGLISSVETIICKEKKRKKEKRKELGLASLRKRKLKAN